MFQPKQNMQTFEELVAEIKRYLKLQKKFVLLELVSKLIMLLAALILSVILFLIGAVALTMLALCAATFIGQRTGDPVLGYGVVALFFVLVAVLVYVKRKQWITRRVTNFLCKLFLKK